MSKKGHIKLHRKITEWRWFKEPNTVVVWLAILANVEWRTGQDVAPGQWFTTVAEIAEITGLSPRNVRTAISHLTDATNGSTNEVTSRTTNKGTVITVENWAFYQANPREATSKVTSKATSKATNLPLYKKNEEVKEEQRATGTCEFVPMPEELKEKLLYFNRKAKI